tara:strand:- start:1310 stop:1552 length:243 start_codon:yes stop_codon:yes gene_type:complete
MIEKYIYHKIENLPEEGWFHPCFLCYTITGQYKKIENVGEKIYDYNVYLCKPCQKKILKDTELENKYRKMVIKFIRLKCL